MVQISLSHTEQTTLTDLWGTSFVVTLLAEVTNVTKCDIFLSDNA
jgi:hypothetical protein